MNRYVFAIAIAIAVAPCVSSAHAALYNIVDLGTLGGASSFALDVNNHRQVTGNAQLPADQPSPRLNGFLWEQPGPMVNLGVIPGSNNFSRGYAINDAGVIVGESDNNSSQAFVFQSGAVSGLTSLAGTSFSGVAHDVNADGIVVGISSSGSTSRPTRWTAGVPIDLGSLDGATTTLGCAWGVNDLGVVVGATRRQSVPTSISQATLWNAPGSPINLGSLQPDSFSEAFAINDAGVAVGAAVNGATMSGTSIRRPVRWTPDGLGNYAIEDLGALERTFGEAKDINDVGDTVGSATNISGLPQVAWVHRGGQTIDLNSLIPAGSDWTLTSAEGINDRGDVVGFGTFGGQARAFLLTIPEPGTISLAALFAAVAPRRRKRRQARFA